MRIAQLVRSPHDRGAAAGAVIIELLDARVRITVDGGADREAVTAVLALAGEGAADLFDENFQPKPALAAVQHDLGLAARAGR